MKQILTLNAGSSSLKYALFNCADKTIKAIVASGIVEKIGESIQLVKHTNMKNSKKLNIEENSLLNHKTALEYTLSLMTSQSIIDASANSIIAVGHRVVHGGADLTKSQIINDKVVDVIRKAIPLAPLHNPANLVGIDTALEIFPSNVNHVATFDTSFHSTLPKHSYLYALPLELNEKFGVRKYGFHGISHEYVMKQAARYLNKPITSVNLITCHLGAGSSIACIRNGECIDTSMGMTPLEGLIMATRCGDIDASIVFYLAKQLNLPLNEIEKLLLNKSGWYGLTGHKDARDVEKAYKSGDENAITTLNTVVHRIRKYLGAYYWNLGGNVDAIVFTAGIGENWAELRRLCLQNCEEFGLKVDVKLNENMKFINGTADISSAESAKKILVIPTNEELLIAENTLSVISQL